MYSIFRYMPIAATSERKNGPLYQAWLSDINGNYVMEYLMELNTLRDFCALMHYLHVRVTRVR